MIYYFTQNTKNNPCSSQPLSVNPPHPIIPIILIKFKIKGHINCAQQDMRAQNQRDKIYTYLNNKQITSVGQLPVPFSQRSATDICCTIVTSLFAIAMFVLACVVFNGDKLAYITYPTDRMGRKCTLDNQMYNYLYFTAPNDGVHVSDILDEKIMRIIVPNRQLGQTEMPPNQRPVMFKKLQPSILSPNISLSLYCFPTDQSLKQKILESANLQQRFDFVKSYRSIWISAGVAFALGMIFLLLNCCINRAMVYVSIALGGICFVGIAVLLIIWNSKVFKYYSPALFILAAIFLILGAMLLSSICCKTSDIALGGQYLHKSVLVLQKQKVLFLMVPIFLALTTGLIALCWFQLCAYWSNSDLKLNNNEVYYSPEGTFAWLMQFLDLIQFIWGLCFLKQVFNYIVSSCGVTNTYLGDSYIMQGVKGLFRFHWGSAVASSFLLNFFYLPDIIYDFFKPNQKNRGCYNCFTTACCLCDRTLGFARSETMAFINAVGLPYCNSSRWCERINYLSSYFDGSQSIFRYFSLGSHVLLASAATAIGFLYSTASGSTPHQLVLLFSFALNIFVVTFFVSLLKNLAESILLCTLIDKYLKGQDLYPENDNQIENRSPSKAKNMQQSNVQQGYEILNTQH